MPHLLSWSKLLSSKRPKNSDSSPTGQGAVIEDERSPFERDYDRIVFSAPFRRLARKTQVHPLATNSQIHNRLTHTMEVASVGRGFRFRLAKILKDRSDLSSSQEKELGWILQSACLIHDLGNPPFGHAGEEVVRAWTEKHYDEMFQLERFEDESELKETAADWLKFEGNAQGFRLAARTDLQDNCYLNLTHATLAAAVKYPWMSNHKLADTKNKHNFYSTEKSLFQEMAQDLGLVMKDGSVCRHPLSFLTEAADDICYRIIDLEDAVEMGLQDYESVHKLFLDISGSYGSLEKNLPQLRGYAIKALMDEFWSVFENDFDAIMNGERTEDLKSSIVQDVQDQLGEISTSYEKIFGHSKKVSTELGAYHILGRILKALMKTVHALHDSASYGDVPFLSKRCAELVWGRDYAKKNFDKSHQWWLANMNDFVSGMTDDHAVKLSDEIGGHNSLNR